MLSFIGARLALAIRRAEQCFTLHATRPRPHAHVAVKHIPDVGNSTLMYLIQQMHDARIENTLDKYKMHPVVHHAVGWVHDAIKLPIQQDIVWIEGKANGLLQDIKIVSASCLSGFQPAHCTSDIIIGRKPQISGIYNAARQHVCDILISELACLRIQVFAQHTKLRAIVAFTPEDVLMCQTVLYEEFKSGEEPMPRAVSKFEDHPCDAKVFSIA